MRFVILMLSGLWLIFAAPAAAQDSPGEARRLVLAERYLELTQGQTLRKSIETYFEETFAKADMPPDQREWLAQNMATSFDQALQATFVDVRDDVAELFTEEELEAMIAFSDSPMGRSITEKSFEFGIRLQTVMAPHIVTAFTQLGEKFCARFDCEAGADAAIKSTP